MFEPCELCGQCSDEAIGGPLACIVCEREGRYARERILAGDLALLAGNSAGGVLGSGETVGVILPISPDAIPPETDETEKRGPISGMSKNVA